MPRSNLIRYCLVLTNILRKPPHNIWSVAVKVFLKIQSTTKKCTHRVSPVYVQYFENILASVSSFMNDSHTGHDTGAPSGTHKPALINFLSKRDSELMENRASFLRLPLFGFISNIFLWLWGYSGPYFDLTSKKKQKTKKLIDSWRCFWDIFLLGWLMDASRHPWGAGRLEQGHDDDLLQLTL